MLWSSWPLSQRARLYRQSGWLSHEHQTRRLGPSLIGISPSMPKTSLKQSRLSMIRIPIDREPTYAGERCGVRVPTLSGDSQRELASAIQVRHRCVNEVARGSHGVTPPAPPRSSQVLRHVSGLLDEAVAPLGSLPCRARRSGTDQAMRARELFNRS